ncbi:MAG: hypothetical protein IKO07_10625 [Clostridia bacterium]|nr:hypothetical protein [Clostridia bacterium]
MKGTCETLRVGGRRGVLYLSPGGGVRALLVACCGDRLEDMLPEIERFLAPRMEADVSPFALASLPDADWDADYTPWPSTELNGREMAGRADALLDATQGPLLSAALDRLGGAARVGILGYSLGGLFALYAASKPDSPFDCAASVSGALWYERFADYAAQAPFPRLMRAYVSLGLKEAKTSRGPMGRNKAASEAIHALLAARLGDENAAFEWNNGNHFFEVPQRIGKAIAYLCKL